jgi:hypothetical protein
MQENVEDEVDEVGVRRAVVLKQIEFGLPSALNATISPSTTVFSAREASAAATTGNFPVTEFFSRE